TMVYFILFILVHLFLVFTTGVLSNLNMMFTARDASDWWGIGVFAVSVAVTVGIAWLIKPIFVSPIAEKPGTVSTRYGITMILNNYNPIWETEEHTDLREMAREFMASELTPNQERFAKNHEVDRDLWNKAGDNGLLLISAPEEYGGGGANFSHEAAVLYEQGLAGDDSWGYSIHSTIVAHYIVAYGTEEQKQRWLPRLATGERVAAIAMTEPTTGS